MSTEQPAPPWPIPLERKETFLRWADGFAAREIVNLGRFSEQEPIVLFDCGANRGIWTQAFFKCYPNATIFAHLFEPSHKNCNFIRRRHQEVFGPFAAHHTMKLNEVAVGEHDEPLTLFSDSAGSAMASFVRRPDLPMTLSETVQAIALDGYAEREGVERIDLLKLDVEGWEWRALKGAKRLLAEARIGGVLFEFTQCNVFTRTFFHDLWLMLHPAGFQLFYIDPHQEYRLRPIFEYSGQWEMFWGTSMFYARHKTLPVEPVICS